MQLVAGRPVLHPDHKLAETAADFLQPLNPRDRILRRPHNPLIVFHHKIHNPLPRNIRHRIPQSPPEILGHHPGAPLPNILKRLLPGIRQMHPHHDAPILPAHRLAVFGGGFLRYIPQLHQRSPPDGIPRHAQRQHRRPMLARSSNARRRLHRGHRHRHMRILVWPQLNHRLVKLKPVALVADRIRFGHQPHNDAQRLVHHRPLVFRPDAQHQRIRRQSPRPDAQNHPPPGKMIQLHKAVSHHIRMMIRQADHPRPQPDVPGALRRGSHKHLRRRDRFPPRAMVFPDIGFVKPQRIQPLDQLQVPLQRQRRVFPNPMERSHKDAEFHLVSNAHRQSSPISSRPHRGGILPIDCFPPASRRNPPHSTTARK